MPDRILAILCVKDEGAFLPEWVAHHRAIGVTDILAFSNDCSDGTDVMLDRLQTLGLVTHVRNDAGPKGPQWSALQQAANHPLYHAADWAIVIDIDEFIRIGRGTGALTTLTGPAGQADAITLTWRLYGNDGVASRNGQGMLETFTRAAPVILHWPWKAQMVKTLFRPQVFAKPGVHRPKPHPGTAPVTIDGNGRPVLHDRLFANLSEDTASTACIGHFALGAMDDFVVKAARGRSNRDASTPDAGYWIERNLAVDPAPIPPPATIPDPTLDQLRRQAETWRSTRFATLMQDHAWRQLYGQCRLSGPTRLLTQGEAKDIWARNQQATPGKQAKH
jgi:Glycosyl transferase family 2